jgi:CubicO group peptidase (beta-lactamase class C family)
MKPTRTATFILTLFFCCAPIPAPFAQSTTTAPKPAPPPAARAAAAGAMAAEAAAIDKLFAEVVRPDGPGMAVIVVNHGKTIYRAARGMANLELGVALKPDHVFRIGSVTKQFTSAAIMILAEEGKLAVSDPITKFLPDYPTQGKTITIEHLLTHTSGIQSYTDMQAWRGRLREDFSLSALIDLFKNEPMQFAPGEKWRYNNSGYILLGAVVEKVSGKPYAEFVKERIFTPLGMKDTRYDVTDDVIPRRAAGYGRTDAGFQNAVYLSMTQPYAAGALLSTVDDLARWDAGLTAGTLVPPASLEKMFTNYRLADGAPSGYGYGWQIASYDGRPVQEHGGGIPGFRAHVLRVPSGGVFVAVLSNIAAPTPDPQSFARKAAAVALGKPLVDPPAVALTAEQLEAYVGRYVTAAGTRHVVTRDGARLFVQFGGGARTELFASGSETFFEKGGFARVRFQRDAAGKVIRLEIDNFGARPAATRDDTPEKKPAAAEVKVDTATYDAYVGEYELMPGFILTVTREGDRLMTQATGQSKVEVFPSSPTEFFLKVVEARISFVKDASGAVTGLVLHQGGRDMPAKKIR